MMTIAGILRPRRGSIRLAGSELVGLSPARIVAQGVALVPENRLVFPHMSVRENLLAGAYQRRDRAEIDADIERMYARFPRLRERSRAVGRHALGRRAADAGGGARADVAAAHPADGRAFARARAAHRRRDLRASSASSIATAPRSSWSSRTPTWRSQVAHQFFLMEQGRITFRGTPGQLAEDEVIQRAYLGTRRAAG